VSWNYLTRHSREGGNPAGSAGNVIAAAKLGWIPARAALGRNDSELAYSYQCTPAKERFLRCEFPIT
jgi:hypothetical protein